MEISELRVESELQLPAYATAIIMVDLSHICKLHYRLQRCWILNPPSKARDWTQVLMDVSQICYHWAMMGTPINSFKYSFQLWFVMAYWVWFPVLYSRTLLLIHSICNSLHLLIPNSKSIPPVSPSSPLATTSLFSMSVNLFLFCR